jgi:hypothetical protein
MSTGVNLKLVTFFSLPIDLIMVDESFWLVKKGVRKEDTDRFREDSLAFIHSDDITTTFGYSSSSM